MAYYTLQLRYDWQISGTKVVQTLEKSITKSIVKSITKHRLNTIVRLYVYVLYVYVLCLCCNFKSIWMTLTLFETRKQ